MHLLQCSWQQPEAGCWDRRPLAIVSVVAPPRPRLARIPNDLGEEIGRPLETNEAGGAEVQREEWNGEERCRLDVFYDRYVRQAGGDAVSGATTIR